MPHSVMNFSISPTLYEPKPDESDIHIYYQNQNSPSGIPTFGIQNLPSPNSLRDISYHRWGYVIVKGWLDKLEVLLENSI